MAVVQNSLIGRTRGSIGGVTFSTQFGLNVAKAKPVSVANPQTDKQIMRRSALTQTTKIGRALLGIISVTFRSLAIGKSAYNAFAGLCLQMAFDYSTPPLADFDPSLLFISRGTIQSSEIETCTVQADLVNFDFSDLASGAGQSLSDLAVIVVYNATNDKWLGSITSDTRSAGSSVLDVTLISSANPVYHGYLAFVNEAGDKASDSVYSVVTPSGA